ncbi:hypothetical protein [Alteromonas macleodii]|uniref:hypothetical protein n=1 Tax=Alteromonas macleodii TaxID=28108 RepID=UPI001930DE97|nr:hypothetical protein [Alteromonas macleodii]
MKYHPITDTIDLQASQRDILDTHEFKSVYPTLSEYLDSFEQQGIPAKNNLKQLLNFLVTGLSNAKGTQSRFRNEAERFTLFCLHVPAHSDHPFRFNPITDFGLIRSPISELSDQK